VFVSKYAVRLRFRLRLERIFHRQGVEFPCSALRLARLRAKLRLFEFESIVKVKLPDLPKRSKMTRRIVVGILVVSLLAPGVAVPHSHAGTPANEPAGYDHQPHSHFTLSWLYTLVCHDDTDNVNSDRDRTHNCADGHSHPHNSDAFNDQSSGMPLRDHEDDPVSHEEHDDDALYASGPVVTTKPTCWSEDSVMFLITWLPSLEVFDSPSLALMPTPESLPPPTGRHTCPIYLEILALLI
jgi:hypothetical protein